MLALTELIVASPTRDWTKIAAPWFPLVPVSVAVPLLTITVLPWPMMAFGCVGPLAVAKLLLIVVKPPLKDVKIPRRPPTV